MRNFLFLRISQVVQNCEHTTWTFKLKAFLSLFKTVPHGGSSWKCFFACSKEISHIVRNCEHTTWMFKLKVFLRLFKTDFTCCTELWTPFLTLALCRVADKSLAFKRNLFLRDNAAPHKAAITHQKLEYIHFEVLKYIANSPDLTPTTSFLTSL
jgi:hypothetical protein